MFLMQKIKNISIGHYNYHLPDELIAKYPLPKRDGSKLLVYRQGEITERQFHEIEQLIPPKSLMVFNNTKVIRARLEFFKNTGARIEVFCLEPHQPSDYSQAFAQTSQCQWSCIVGNVKKWKEGIIEKKVKMPQGEVSITVKRLSTLNGEHIIEFKWNNPNITFGELLESQGNIPIPPYLNRDAEDSDLKTYQTIYSKNEGSVAAPTAGLHFTNEVLNALQKRQITLHEVTLHVGAGTFKPVKSNEIGGHPMHPEHFLITTETIPILISHLGKITAVGTTTVRTLESLYWLGVKLLSSQNHPELELGQWECYELPQQVPLEDALLALHARVLESGNPYVMAATSIMIAPGYSFKMVDRLITNFHQPKSTLLLLIAAFIGDDWKNIYQFALDHQFRFLSYGDSNLLLRT
jgi:S-adenosylmethionine:tRNA ribosyltransferase-isomerase